MKNNLHIFRALLMLGAVFVSCIPASGQGTQTVIPGRVPKHYFNTVVLLDAYRKPGQVLKDTVDRIGHRLKSYGIRQLDLSFCIPLVTREDHSDSLVIRNTHLLLTGNYSLLQPVFDGISQHRLAKIGIGLRYIINTGKKGLWFIDAAPFITRDASYPSRAYFRLASTVVYSYNVNAHLNWRLGVTKSFLWGNRFYLPFIGLRIGRLDQLNLSIQFPRSISLSMPLSSAFIFSMYTRPQGGMYAFSNHDSLYYRKQDATFTFTRYEIVSGLRLDVRAGRNFNFYLSAGISSRNRVTFYSDRANNKRQRAPYRTYFYTEKTAPTVFVNAGLVLKFGKTRSYFQNTNLYDAMDLNNVMDRNGNTQIPLPAKKKRSDANLESVRDLVDYNDF